MSSTNFAKNKILDYAFGNISYTPPANLYMGLSTTSISSSGSNASEPVGASYARVAIPNNKTGFTYASSGCLVNAGSIVFSQSSGSWGTIVDVGFWDAVTSGSIWYYSTLGTPMIIQNLTIVSFSASQITISES